MGSAQPRRVLVGGYSGELDGTATGVSSLLVTLDEGVADVVLAGTYDAVSPSYLVSHPTRPWVFAVSEATPASVISLAVGAHGQLREISTVSTGDAWACHLCVSADGCYVLVANYAGGSVSSHAIGPDGSLSLPVDRYQLVGQGPDPERQAGPHAHQVVVFGGEVLVCDLGGDQVVRLRLGLDGRFETAADPVRLPPGSGPRHLVVVDGHLVALCELTAEIWLGRPTAGGWQQVMTVPSSSVPALDDAVRTYPSAIRAEGTRVYAANRGVGTIAVFDLRDGRLEPITEFSGGGTWPRDIALADGELWVADQRNNVVTVFSTATVPPNGPAYEIATSSPAVVVVLVADGEPGDSVAG